MTVSVSSSLKGVLMRTLTVSSTISNSRVPRKRLFCMSLLAMSQGYQYLRLEKIQLS